MKSTRGAQRERGGVKGKMRSYKTTTFPYKYTCMLIMGLLYCSLYLSTTVAFAYTAKYSSLPRMVKSKSVSKLQMISGSDLNIRIKNALEKQYPGKAYRVVTCWENFEAGKKLSRYIDTGMFTNS